MSTTTQSSHNFKPLYEFTVDVEKEIEREESVTTGDTTTIVKTKVKDKVPMFLCFKKPSRAEREEADSYRAVAWTDFVKKGVLPEALLLKEYANFGGILSDDDKKFYNGLRVKLLETMENYQRLRGLKDDVAAVPLMNDIIDLRDKIISFERQQAVFFENTAEAKARLKLTEYLFLHQSYQRDAADKPWEPVFKGADIAAKYLSLEAIEEAADPVYIQARDRLLFVASMYISLNGNLSKEDIAAFEKELVEGAVEEPAKVG